MSDAKTEYRIGMIILRIASGNRFLQREWLTTDPILRDMQIFRQAQGTNFKLNNAESFRLAALWARTGVDWTWRDSAAGLWAYVQTKGKEVSKLPGSPVSKVAIEIGRAVTGVYNKVMNFRSIDPTEPRSGLTGAGAVDRHVWSAFFDTAEGQISDTRLNSEMVRIGLGSLLGENPDIYVDSPPILHVAGELDELMEKYELAISSGVYPLLPTLKTSPERKFQRNPLVVAIAKKRAKFSCEIPGCKTPKFDSIHKEVYCEVHHVLPLSEGGMDSIQNAICLCPVHHREAHFGTDRSALRETMQKIRLRS